MADVWIKKQNQKTDLCKSVLKAEKPKILLKEETNSLLPFYRV